MLNLTLKSLLSITSDEDKINIFLPFLTASYYVSFKHTPGISTFTIYVSHAQVATLRFSKRAVEKESKKKILILNNLYLLRQKIQHTR